MYIYIFKDEYSTQNLTHATRFYIDLASHLNLIHYSCCAIFNKYV